MNVRHQTITWSEFEPELRRHITSHVRNDLKAVQKQTL